MRKATVALFCVAIGALCPAVCAADRARYEPLFDEIWTTVDANFYDPSFHGVDWHKVGNRYRSQLATVADDQAFQRLATAMLSELHASHMGLSAPVANQAKGGVGIGASFEHIGDALVVSEVAPLSDAQRKGLRAGEVVTQPSEGLRGPLGQSVAFQVTGCDGNIRNLSVRREFSSWPPPQPSFTWRQITLKPGLMVGYIRPDRFDDGTAELIDKAMHDLHDTQALVIDLRGSGGGGGNLSALRLVSYFSGPGKPMAALFARSYLQQLGHAPTKADIGRLAPTQGAYTDASIFKAVDDGHGAAVFYSEDVGAWHYSGRVVVVMDVRTSSAGEGFASAMRRMAGATLVGRPTAGYLLSSKRFPLSGGWMLTLPVDGVWGADGSDMGDKPTEPDVTVPRSVADICQGRDLDLERAIDVVEARPK